MNQIGIRVGALALFAIVGVGCGGGDDPATDAAVDAASSDGSAPDAAGLDAPPAASLLSNQGLYVDIATKTIASDLIAYEPEFALWSDGSVKRRWLRLPPGTQIDTDDPDHWIFPMGTELYKEFAAPDGTLLETRVIRRTGTGTDPRVDYFFGSFVWQDDEGDAVFTQTGARDVRGTQHDVPSQGQCFKCHDGETGFVLGFSAVQLALGTPSLVDLDDAGHLSSPLPAIVGPPGEPAERAAMGSIHANCGHCHNPLGEGADFAPSMVLRVAVAEGAGTVGATALVTSTCNSGFEFYDGPTGVDVRLAPGDSAGSAIAFRMSQRGNGDTMPPNGTEFVDGDGLAAVDAWIDAMTPGVCPP